MPNNTIVAIVGDFKTDEVIAEIKRLTADWKPRDVPAAKLPPPKKPTRRLRRTIITVPEANQLYVYLGHRGIRRNDPNYYKLLVMDNVLGTGSGFTDRLSANLRDRQGLAYTVNASITGDAGEEPGTFTCFIGTFPDKLAAVKEGCLKEIERSERNRRQLRKWRAPRNTYSAVCPFGIRHPLRSRNSYCRSSGLDWDLIFGRSFVTRS